MPKRVNHLDIEVFPGVGFIFGRPHLEVIILPTAGESGPVIGITQTAGDLATLWIESPLRLLPSVADCHRSRGSSPAAWLSGLAGNSWLTGGVCRAPEKCDGESE